MKGEATIRWSLHHVRWRLWKGFMTLKVLLLLLSLLVVVRMILELKVVIVVHSVIGSLLLELYTVRMRISSLKGRAHRRRMHHWISARWRSSQHGISSCSRALFLVRIHSLSNISRRCSERSGTRTSRNRHGLHSAVNTKRGWRNGSAHGLTLVSDGMCLVTLDRVHSVGWRRSHVHVLLFLLRNGTVHGQCTSVRSHEWMESSD